MQGNNLVTLERQFQPLIPRFEQVLDKRVSPQRLVQTILISVERLPKLLECDRQSLFNAAMSAAVLGLEVDGVTGQAFLIPFKNKAQLVIGYKGYSTLAARSGITIAGGIVREGDLFEYELGSSAYARHVPVLGNKGRIVAAWAAATSKNRPPVVAVLGIDELMAVKSRSPGAKRDDSPWNDPNIGFPAMCEKTAKRRLARSLPLNIIQTAARLDEAFDEQGANTWISPDKGVVIEGELQPRYDATTPTVQQVIGPKAQARDALDELLDRQAPPDMSEVVKEYDKLLAAAADKGEQHLRAVFRDLPNKEAREACLTAIEVRHMPRAREVDAAADESAEFA